MFNTVILYIITLSLSIIVQYLIVGIDMNVYGFPYLKTTLQQHFFQILAIYIYWYDAINTINLFKQLKCALESKLSDFKIFENCKNFCLTH